MLNQLVIQDQLRNELKGDTNMKKKMISEYGGKEKYPSKAAKAKHEKKETKTFEKKEKPGAKKMPPTKMKKC